MVTLADARNVIAAAENKAIEIRQPMNIAVVDAGGNLVIPRPHGWRMDRQYRHLNQQGLHFASVRYLNARSRATLTIGRPVFRNSRVQPRARDGFCRRCPLEARWEDCRRGRCKWRLRRAGSHCSGSRSPSILTFELERRLYGKQSWSCVRRNGKGRGTFDRFSQIISRPEPFNTARARLPKAVLLAQRNR